MKVHTYSAASPEMDTSAMSDLVNSIQAQGQLVPILVWRGEVIDGRKRLAACEALGIAPRLETLSDDADGARVAVDANVLRTHYTPSQRAMFAASIATATVEDSARFREMRRKDHGYQLIPVVPTRKEAASLLHVSDPQVARAKHIQRTAAPEVVDAVRRGELTLHAAGKIAAEVSLEDQPRVTAEVVAGKQGTRNTPHAIISGASGFRLARRDVAASLERGIEAMLATVESLASVADAASLNDMQREHLTGTLRQIIRAARTLERALSHGVPHAHSA